MKYATNKNFCKKFKGFTLVESVIAMGIIAIMITAFLAAFGPAVKGVDKAISIQESKRLVSALEQELSLLRNGNQKNDYNNSFEKALTWIKESTIGDKTKAIILYSYRGDPVSAEEDDTASPKLGEEGDVSGVDYVLTSVVRRLEDEAVVEELRPRVVEGRVYLVRMRQLVFDNDQLVVSDSPGEIVEPNDPSSQVTNLSDYPEASILVRAEFYRLKSNVFTSMEASLELDTEGKPQNLGKPVLVRDIAIIR